MPAGKRTCIPTARSVHTVVSSCMRGPVLCRPCVVALLRHGDKTLAPGCRTESRADARTGLDPTGDPLRGARTGADPGGDRRAATLPEGRSTADRASANVDGMGSATGSHDLVSCPPGIRFHCDVWQALRSQIQNRCASRAKWTGGDPEPARLEPRIAPTRRGQDRALSKAAGIGSGSPEAASRVAEGALGVTPR